MKWRAATTHLPETTRTRQERQGTTRTLGTGRRSLGTRQYECANAWREEEKRTHQGELEASKTTRETKRTRRRHQDAMKTLGSGRGSCGTRQNVNVNARSKERRKTHRGETAVPGDPHGYQEGPTDDGNGSGSDTNAPSRDTGPGGCGVELGQSRGVEGVRDRVKVVNGAGYDGNRPRSQENERVDKANTPCRDRGPGGDSGEQVESGDVGSDQEHQSDGDGNEMDGIRGGMGGATSGTRRDSK